MSKRKDDNDKLSSVEKAVAAVSAILAGLVAYFYLLGRIFRQNTEQAESEQRAQREVLHPGGVLHDRAVGRADEVVVGQAPASMRNVSGRSDGRPAYVP